MTDQPNMPVRVVQYGLGPIGLATARTVLEKAATGLVELVGAIDHHAGMAGMDLADLLSLQKPSHIEVSADADELLARVRPNVVLHTTSSFLDRVHPQIEQCVRAGAHVISSTEELLYPFHRYPELSLEIDELARSHNVVVIGTGVNPGFAMDVLPLVATTVCTEVHGIRIERVVDASRRRKPLQVKIGAGLTAEDFHERKQTGHFGHIGLLESLLLVASALNWRLDRIEETLEPVLATRRTPTSHLMVEAGHVAGIHHAAHGFIDGDRVLSLELRMFVGAEDSRDTISIAGNPTFEINVPGGIFGDTATVAMIVNLLPLVLKTPPGLRTMLDIPLPRAFATTVLASHQATGRL